MQTATSALRALGSVLAALGMTYLTMAIVGVNRWIEHLTTVSSPLPGYMSSFLGLLTLAALAFSLARPLGALALWLRLVFGAAVGYLVGLAAFLLSVAFTSGGLSRLLASPRQLEVLETIGPPLLLPLVLMAPLFGLLIVAYERLFHRLFGQRFREPSSGMFE